MGRTNPTVSLKVVYLDNIAAGPNEIDVIPSNYLPADYVLFDVTWPTNDEVSAIVTNRVQNSARLRRCSILTNTCADVNTLAMLLYVILKNVQNFLGKRLWRRKRLVRFNRTNLQFQWGWLSHSAVSTRRRWFLQTFSPRCC